MTIALIAALFAAPPSARVPLRASAPLDHDQHEAAEQAWEYLRRNTEATGLINAVDKQPTTTLWDLGSALAGMIAAQELGILSQRELEENAGKLLDGLLQAPLVDGKLPNRAYDTRTLAMNDLAGKPIAGAGSSSAVEIGRFCVPLEALVWRAPALAPRIRALLGRWKLDALAKDGELLEGRLGYEQYAARALSMFEVDAALSRRFDRHLRTVKVEGVDLPADDRKAPIASEPWIVYGLELGLDAEARPLAEAIYRAQAARTKKSGKLTAVAEDRLDRPPFFLSAFVWNNGAAWPGAGLLSTKAAIGFGALFADANADALLKAGVDAAFVRGVMSGKYDRDGEFDTALTADTAGIALEALAYRQLGPLLKAARADQ